MIRQKVRGHAKTTLTRRGRQVVLQISSLLNEPLYLNRLLKFVVPVILIKLKNLFQKNIKHKAIHSPVTPNKVFLFWSVTLFGRYTVVQAKSKHGKYVDSDFSAQLHCCLEYSHSLYKALKPLFSDFQLPTIGCGSSLGITFRLLHLCVISNIFSRNSLLSPSGTQAIKEADNLLFFTTRGTLSQRQSKFQKLPKVQRKKMPTGLMVWFQKF